MSAQLIAPMTSQAMSRTASVVAVTVTSIAPAKSSMNPTNRAVRSSTSPAAYASTGTATSHHSIGSAPQVGGVVGHVDLPGAVDGGDDGEPDRHLDRHRRDDDDY